MAVVTAELKVFHFVAS